jgi:hypothetical protein
MDPKRVKSYNQIKMCMCVEWWVYMVANPNSSLLLENISLIWNLKTFARKHGLSYSYFFSFLFFFRRASKYPLFYLFKYLSIFSQYFLFLNNFCVAHASLLQWKWLRDSNKNLKHLFCSNLYGIFLVFSPSVGVKHFWMDGWHILAPTPTVGVVPMWVVCTWSWF